MAIDRRSVVERHNVSLTAPDAQSPLTVGNGDFACTVDITGMQTCTEFHDPLRAPVGRLVTNTCTQTTWGWHEMPNPDGYTLADAMSVYATSRGDVEYPDKHDVRAMVGGGEPEPDMAAGTWLHQNPHRLDLGRVGLLLRSSPDVEPERDPQVLTNVHQRLSLWSGTIRSSFVYAGETVSVTTAAHPERAEVAFRIDSALLATGLLDVGLAFPYASDHFMKTANWDGGDRHSTVVEEWGDGARILRTLDATTYTVALAWDAAALHPTDDPHRLRLRAQNDRLDLVVSYADGHERPPRGARTRPSPPRSDGGRRFGRAGRPSTFPGARTHAPASSSGGSCCRSTSRW